MRLSTAIGNRSARHHGISARLEYRYRRGARKLPAEGLLKMIWDAVGHAEIGMSTVSVMELEHGIWRADDDQRAHLRRQFLEDVIFAVPIYPITTERARSAGP